MKARLAILFTLAAIGAVAAPPALAANPPLVAGGSFGRTVPFIDGSIYAFECHAAAPGAISTTISSCSLNSVDGPVAAPAVTTQGPAAATYGAVSTSVSITYQVCWTASAKYADGTTQSTSGCSSSSSVAGAG